MKDAHGRCPAVGCGPKHRHGYEAMEDTLRRRAVELGDGNSEPLLRPFEIAAIACGVATLIGTFVVSQVLLKGLLIGGSLLGLIGSLLYFGVASTGDGMPGDTPTSIPRPQRGDDRTPD